MIFMIKCEKCNSENKKGAKFCSECGAELIEAKPSIKEEKKLKKEEKRHSKAFKAQNIVIVVLVLAILLVGFLFFGGTIPSFASSSYNQPPPQRQTCRDVQVPYSETEYYTESVPYTDQECETKNLVFNLQKGNDCNDRCTKTVEVCLKYFLGICSSKETRCVAGQADYSITVTNLDDEGGVWSYSGIFNTDSGRLDGGTVRQYIYPRGSETFRFQYKWSGNEANPVNPDLNSCSYSTEEIPQKEICRDVIKYKDVQKSRQVTKYRTEEQCS